MKKRVIGGWRHRRRGAANHTGYGRHGPGGCPRAILPCRRRKTGGEESTYATRKQNSLHTEQDFCAQGKIN